MQACDSIDFTQHNKYTSLTTPTPTPAHTNTRNPSPKHPGPLTTPGQIIPTLPAKGTRGKQTEVALNASLGNSVRPNYLIPQRENPSPLGPCTPPSDSPLSALEAISPGAVLSLGLAKEVGKTEDGVGKRGTGELMRPEVRHHLVDIHGLAVFLRRSTRCLSCREAFCLYVTGKISAHLAAVTQVKITCQKCNYTTSQTLSKPSGFPDDHHSPQPPPPTPAPAPTPVTATPGAPQDTTIPPPPPYPNPPPYPQKPRHQTVIKLLKEENLSPSEALLKGKDVPSIALKSMPTLHPLRPIEKVWIKEEGKGEVPEPSLPKEALGRVEKVEEEVKEEIEEEGTVGLDATFDPLSTDWCQWSGIPISSSASSSSSVLPRLQLISSSSSGGGQLRTTITTTTSTTIDTPTTSSSPPTISLPSPKESPETKKKASGILQRVLKGRKKVGGHPKGSSMSTPATFSSSNTSNHPSGLPTTDGMYLNPASSVFTVFSATQSPYALPITSNLLQSTPAAPTIPSEPSQQLRQALEIKQKLERDLEASLQLVRRMIQVSPESIALTSTQDRKGTRSTKGVQDGAVSSYPHPGTTSQEELLAKESDAGGLGRSISGYSGGSSKRKRERRYKNKGTQMGNLETKGAKGKTSRSRKRDAGGRGGGGGDEERRDARSRGGGDGEEKRNARVKGGNTEENEGSKRRRRKTIKTSTSQESEGPFTSLEALQPTQGYQERMEEALFDMLKQLKTSHSGESSSGGDCKKEQQEGDLQTGGRGDGGPEGGGNQSSSTHPPSCRCCSVPDSSNSPPPTVTTSTLPPVGVAGGVGEEQEGVGIQSEVPHHPNSSCKCCNISHSSHSSLPTPASSSSSSAPVPSLSGSIETWDHAPRQLGDHASRKRLRKATMEGPSGVSHNAPLLHLISALQHASPPSPPPPPPPADATRDPTPSGIPDSVLDQLKKNLTHLVQKNSLKLALRRLVRRRTSRSSFSSSSSTSRARKYVKISVGVDEEGEEEEETKEGLLGRVAEGGGGDSGQEEGKSTTWRFHDLLSSDSDSDPEDGRLVIDTGH